MKLSTVLSNITQITTRLHASLQSLNADDHAQYHTDARGNALYAPIAAGVTNGNNHDHVGGDGAAIVEAAITLADNVTNNVSTARHGLVPKAPNVITQFLRGDGAWAVTTAPLATLSDVFIFGNDTQRSTTSATYVKLKETSLAVTLPNVRVKFDMFGGASGTQYGRVYKNGVAIGTEQSKTGAGTTTYSQDFTGIAAGDLIQVYGHCDGTNVVTILNFRFYYTLGSGEASTGGY